MLRKLRLFVSFAIFDQIAESEKVKCSDTEDASAVARIR